MLALETQFCRKICTSKSSVRQQLQTTYFAAFIPQLPRWADSTWQSPAFWDGLAVYAKLGCHWVSLSPPPPQPFYGPFPGPPRWASARRELLGFMVQGKINRGRHTDHLAGHHSIRTNQCPSPSSPHFLQTGCLSCRPTNSVKALKATSAFGLGRRR